MHKLLANLLRRYDSQDHELYLKAGFIVTTVLIVIATLLVILLYTSMISKVHTVIMYAEAVGFTVILGALFLLIRGYYVYAVHIILITGFSTAWVIMFLEPPGSVLTKLDTIVFVIGLLTALPMMIFRHRKPLVAYFAANMAVFIGFNLYIPTILDLSLRERMDYFSDNAIVMGFVFVICFHLFAIFNRTLDALKIELAEREKTEKALQESELRLSTHLQDTPVGAVTWDRDLTVVQWNPAAEKIFGYTAGEVIGKRAGDLIFPPPLKAAMDGMFQALVSGTGGRRHSGENLTRSGGIVYCEWYNTLLQTPGGKIMGMASLVNDVTERKKTEEMIIQSEKMMSVGGLAAGMAHEINNPLSGMMQSAQVIKNRLTREQPANLEAAREAGTDLSVIRTFAEQRQILRQLDNIVQAGSNAAKIVENMLNFARSGSGTLEHCDLGELMDNAVILAENDYDLKKKYDFREIRITREYAGDLPLVPCEESKIQQVLFNLLKNASQAMHAFRVQKGGNEPPRLVLHAFRQGDWACMEVADNGPGMDEETRRRIFEPFFTTKQKDQGTGLGLSVSYFIVVDDHGGRMSVESAPGKGARFKVSLPLAES